MLVQERSHSFCTQEKGGDLFYEFSVCLERAFSLQLFSVIEVQDFSGATENAGKGECHIPESCRC